MSLVTFDSHVWIYSQVIFVYTSNCVEYLCTGVFECIADCTPP